MIYIQCVDRDEMYKHALSLYAYAILSLYVWTYKCISVWMYFTCVNECFYAQMVQIHIHVYISDDESWKYLEIYEISRKKSSLVKKIFEKKIFSTELSFQCRLRKYKRFCVYVKFFYFWDLEKFQVSHRCV